MSPQNPFVRGEGVNLSQAARIAGFGVLAMAFAAPFAEFYVYSKLVVSSDVQETVRNLVSQRGLFVAGIFGYLITFFLDVVVAWALYVLLIPVNRALSLLTAWMRLVYTVMAIGGLLKYMTIYRLLRTSNHEQVVGSDQLHGHVQLLLKSFEYEWSVAFLFFGIHLILLGVLVYRSGYIPKLLGILLAIGGLGYFITYLGPFLYPGANLDFLIVSYFGELIFVLWLVVRGGKIRERTAETV